MISRRSASPPRRSGAATMSGVRDRARGMSTAFRASRWRRGDDPPDLLDAVLRVVRSETCLLTSVGEVEAGSVGVARRFGGDAAGANGRLFERVGGRVLNAEGVSFAGSGIPCLGAPADPGGLEEGGLEPAGDDVIGIAMRGG